MAKLRDEEHLGVLVFAKPGEHMHGLGGCRCFVEKRRSRDLHPAQIHGHGLEIEQGFQAALRNLRLVGGIAGVPARIFEDVALDHRRQDGLGIAHANIGADAAVTAPQSAQLGQGLMLGQRWRELEGATDADPCWNRLFDELVERSRTHNSQHLDQNPLAAGRYGEAEIRPVVWQTLRCD